MHCSLIYSLRSVYSPMIKFIRHNDINFKLPVNIGLEVEQLDYISY